MFRSLFLTLPGLVLLIGACGDNEVFDQAVAEVEADLAARSEGGGGADGTRSDPDAGGAEVDDAGDQDEPGVDEPAAAADMDELEPSDRTSEPDGLATLEASERMVIDFVRGGSSLTVVEATCLVDGWTSEGIDAGDLADGSVDLDDDIDVLLGDLILQCVDQPERMAGFVEGFAVEYSQSAGLDLDVKEAACLMSALRDHGASFADLRLATPLPFLTEALETCSVLEEGLFEPGFTYGDNEALDPLWEDCEAGVMAACDDLYSLSEIGSDYEAFGATCGRVQPGAAGGTCAAPFSYGDNADLDAYWDACEDGDGAACDQLYVGSQIGSVYEEFGYTCGYRYETEDSPVVCESALG